MQRKRHSHAGRRLAISLGVSVLAIVSLAPVASATTLKTRLASQSSGEVWANDASYNPDISATGRFVAFESPAGNLAAGDANTVRDVFVRDFKKGKTELISVAFGDGAGSGSSTKPSISGDARFVAFVSSASENPAISADGRWVAFQPDATSLVSKDTKGKTQVCLFDRKKNKVILVSCHNKGKAGNKAGNKDSNKPSVSGGGTRVVFNSLATNCAKDTNGVADAYMRDRNTKKTRRVSLSWRGKQLSGGTSFGPLTSEPDISADGKWVAFESAATNATRNSTFFGEHELVYARNLATGKPKLVSRGLDRGNDRSTDAEISKRRLRCLLLIRHQPDRRL